MGNKKIRYQLDIEVLIFLKLEYNHVDNTVNKYYKLFSNAISTVPCISA